MLYNSEIKQILHVLTHNHLLVKIIDNFYYGYASSFNYTR